ncbi:MAG: ABC transporter permease subunit [Pseudomonadota bacterium]
MIVVIAYIALFIGCFVIARFIRGRMRAAADFRSLKTVTFGDESAVVADRLGSILSVVVIFIIWAAFTGSSLLPITVPGPFTGQTQFTYTVAGPDGGTDTAEVFVAVGREDTPPPKPEIEDGDGAALNDSASAKAWASALVLFDKNDEWKRKDGAKVTEIDGQSVDIGETVSVSDGKVTITEKGAINFKPDPGWQMQPLYLPSPETTAERFAKLWTEGYKNNTLAEHMFWSLFRVTLGFFIGALVGIPLGYAMGLSGWARGWFDPIVEFMRPIPPLALIPLVIIWFGIGEQGKIVLLFLAALWIMAIAARSGVAGVKISKIHAAYSLGASKWQILRHVIIPNSLPDIFTGARVAMGVCWGTVVAAELVAASEGTGMMIMDASRFSLMDIVIIGIVMIGIIGAMIELLVRALEGWLVPWKGRG